MGSLQQFNLGIISDVKAKQKFGSKLQGLLEEAVHEASYIYEMQLNFVLKIKGIHMYTNSKAPNFAQGCGSDFMTRKLTQLQKKGNRITGAQGATHLFTGCGTGI